MSGKERERLGEIHDDIMGWRRWGPYVTVTASQLFVTVLSDPAG